MVKAEFWADENRVVTTADWLAIRCTGCGHEWTIQRPAGKLHELIDCLRCPGRIWVFWRRHIPPGLCASCRHTRCTLRVDDLKECPYYGAEGKEL